MSELSNVKHKIGDTYRKAYSYFKPINKSSSFIKNGTLTPLEFVEAGDFLTHKFKTWKWQDADTNRTVSYLPKEKQYLITRNVPCKYRIKDLNNIIRDWDVVENDWLLPKYEEENSASDIDEYVPIITEKKEENVNKQINKKKTKNITKENKITPIITINTEK
uniref:Ubiquitin-like-conjugating enzyme ATG3 n=1 Tax=Piliocolobus tephrosceles TaxID=591936 RepID=A0A8C9GR12_9PRIM